MPTGKGETGNQIRLHPAILCVGLQSPPAEFPSKSPIESGHGYNQAMLLTLDLPDELSTALAAPGRELHRVACEALALEAYRENKLSTGQLRRVLGFRTRAQVHEFLKNHGVWLHYTQSDLEHDRLAGDAIELFPEQ
jgi:hypothetical protein